MENTEIVTFNPQEITTYGNRLLNIIIKHEEARSSAENALRQADNRDQIIDFGLTRVAMYLYENRELDLYSVYSDRKEDSMRLYQAILSETGVLSKRIDEETERVIYDYTDSDLKGKYEFNEELRRTDVEEYKRRRSRRTSLNIRLQRVCKAAVTLIDSGATMANLTITQDVDGNPCAKITKGPSEVMGNKDVVQIHSRSVAPVEGASATPTITGLAKISDKKRRKKPEPKAVAEPVEDVSQRDFTLIVNAAIDAIRGLDGNPSPNQTQQLRLLMTEIKNCGIVFV